MTPSELPYGDWAGLFTLLFLLGQQVVMSWGSHHRDTGHIGGITPIHLEEGNSIFHPSYINRFESRSSWKSNWRGQEISSFLPLFLEMMVNLDCHVHKASNPGGWFHLYQFIFYLFHQPPLELAKLGHFSPVGVCCAAVEKGHLSRSSTPHLLKFP